MFSFLRKIAALTWLVLPPLLLSALVHLADPDIPGWTGLTSASALLSVAIIGALTFPFLFLCLRVLLESGWSAFLKTATVVSTCFGLILTAFGSGAITIIGQARTLVGCTCVVLATFLLAVIPAVALGWPRALARRHSGNRA